MIKHRIFAAVTLAEIAVLLGLIGWSWTVPARRASLELPAARALAERLDLTDLALWSEARYTRHPSQADRFAPFQDFPSSLEHFPAGSMVLPPSSWRGDQAEE